MHRQRVRAVWTEGVKIHRQKVRAFTARTSVLKTRVLKFVRTGVQGQRDSRVLALDWKTNERRQDKDVKSRPDGRRRVLKAVRPENGKMHRQRVRAFTARTIVPKTRAFKFVRTGVKGQRVSRLLARAWKSNERRKDKGVKSRPDGGC